MCFHFIFRISFYSSINCWIGNFIQNKIEIEIQLLFYLFLIPSLPPQKKHPSQGSLENFISFERLPPHYVTSKWFIGIYRTTVTRFKELLITGEWEMYVTSKQNLKFIGFPIVWINTVKLLTWFKQVTLFR